MLLTDRLSFKNKGNLKRGQTSSGKTNATQTNKYSDGQLITITKMSSDIGLGEHAVGYYIDSTKRFFNLLNVDGGSWELTGALCAIYHDNLMERIMEAALMDRRYGWTRRIIGALEYLSEHLQSYCNRKRTELILK